MHTYLCFSWVEDIDWISHHRDTYPSLPKQKRIIIKEAIHEKTSSSSFPIHLSYHLPTCRSRFKAKFSPRLPSLIMDGFYHALYIRQGSLTFCMIQTHDCIMGNDCGILHRVVYVCVGVNMRKGGIRERG